MYLTLVFTLLIVSFIESYRYYVELSVKYDKAFSVFYGIYIKHIMQNIV